MVCYLYPVVLHQVQDKIFFRGIFPIFLVKKTIYSGESLVQMLLTFKPGAACNPQLYLDVRMREKNPLHVQSGDLVSAGLDNVHRGSTQDLEHSVLYLNKMENK
jgi:hypothetical protein